MGLFDKAKKAMGDMSSAVSGAQQAQANQDATVQAAYAQTGAAATGYQGPTVGQMTPEQQQALVNQGMAQPMPTQAQADFQNYGGGLDAAALAPAANGVTWQAYAAIIAQSKAVNYDQEQLKAIAAQSGIPADAFIAAGEEFAARGQANPAIMREMGRIVREGRA